MPFPVPRLLGPDELGRPSRKGAAAAVKAHLAVLRGDGMRAAIASALRGALGLGGQERRFVALAARELSRHQRLLDLAARMAGHPIGGLSLLEDQAIVRYALWRRLFTAAPWSRIEAEVGLPGPMRPRAIRDELLREVAEAELPEPPPWESSVARAATLHSFPTWLATAIGRAVPESELEPLLAALGREPPLILRARPPGSREECLRRLEAEGIAASALSAAPDAISVDERGKAVFDSPSFKQGRLQVIDLGSQLIVELCRPAGGFEGATAVDLCAGAGGKAIALADRARRVVAADASRRRLEEGRARVRALGLRNVELAREPRLEEADVLLVDAPCSGTGALAREPEQKWRLSEKGVADFARRQSELLERTAAGARAGAVLVYATCSLLREENEAVVEGLLSRHPELELEPAAPYVGEAAVEGPYLRVLPHRLPGGGFFAARLLRRG